MTPAAFHRQVTVWGTGIVESQRVGIKDESYKNRVGIESRKTIDGVSRQTNSFFFSLRDLDLRLQRDANAENKRDNRIEWGFFFFFFSLLLLESRDVVV